MKVYKFVFTAIISLLFFTLTIFSVKVKKIESPIQQFPQLHQFTLGITKSLVNTPPIHMIDSCFRGWGSQQYADRVTGKMALDKLVPAFKEIRKVSHTLIRALDKICVQHYQHFKKFIRQHIMKPIRHRRVFVSPHTSIHFTKTKVHKPRVIIHRSDAREVLQRIKSALNVLSQNKVKLINFLGVIKNYVLLVKLVIFRLVQCFRSRNDAVYSRLVQIFTAIRVLLEKEGTYAKYWSKLISHALCSLHRFMPAISSFFSISNSDNKTRPFQLGNKTGNLLYTFGRFMKPLNIIQAIK